MLTNKNRVLMIGLAVIFLLNIVFLVINKQSTKDKNEIKTILPEYVVNEYENKTNSVETPMIYKDCSDFNASDSEKFSSPEFVSMLQLICNPEEYDCRKVGIIGYLNLEYESDALYFHYDDYRYGIVKNALRVKVENDLKPYSGKYVLIEGVFHAYPQHAYPQHGRFGLYSGTLDNITRCKVRYDRSLEK